MRPFYKRRLFWILFGIPNFLSVLYFCFVASPEYISQSSLVVYQSAAADSSPVTLQLGQNGGMSVEGDYLVQGFVASWQCFKALNLKALRQSWSSGDFVTQFGGVMSLFETNMTSLYKYYLGHVYTNIDTKSAIMTVSVKGYDPEFVLTLNKDILDKADKAVNNMNNQAYQNTEDFFHGRVEMAKTTLASAIKNITGIQKGSNILTPSTAYSSQLDLINQLTLKKVSMEAQLAVLQRDTPNAAQVHGLQAEITKIDDEVEIISSKLKGNNTSLTSIDGDFAYNQALVQNAESNLLALETQLLTAQQVALQHQYFMEYINQPSVPPNPTSPDRLAWVFGIMAGTFLFYLIVKPNN